MELLNPCFVPGERVFVYSDCLRGKGFSPFESCSGGLFRGGGMVEDEIDSRIAALYEWNSQSAFTILQICVGLLFSCFEAQIKKFSRLIRINFLSGICTHNEKRVSCKVKTEWYKPFSRLNFVERKGMLVSSTSARFFSFKFIDLLTSFIGCSIKQG